MSDEDQKLQPTKATLSIMDEDAPDPETWEDLSREEVLDETPITEGEGTRAPVLEAQSVTRMASAVGAAAAVVTAGVAVVKFLADNSGLDIKTGSLCILNKDDTNWANYTGERFRYPAKGNLVKRFWALTDVTGAVRYFFEITNRAHPTVEGIPDGYYIPDITIHVKRAWHKIGVKISGELEISNPWNEPVGGLIVPHVDLIVSFQHALFGVFHKVRTRKYHLRGDVQDLT